jgi:hypothetical protein
MMSKALQWVIGIGVVLVAAAVIFSTVWPLFMPRSSWTSYGMMGPGHMLGGGGMMGGFGMPLFGLGMLLWPLLVLGLVVAGAVWLARSLQFPPGPQSRPPSGGQACAHCGRPLQDNWQACPYCGSKI